MISDAQTTSFQQRCSPTALRQGGRGPGDPLELQTVLPGTPKCRTVLHFNLSIHANKLSVSPSERIRTFSARQRIRYVFKRTRMQGIKGHVRLHLAAIVEEEILA
jgi:hypothetical protein